MWEREPIPNEDHVYRHCRYNEVIKENTHRFPNEAHFKPDPDGLSVNWDRKITIPQIFTLIGLSFNRNDRFIDHKQFQLFRFPVSFLRSVPGIESVEHDPVFHGNPSPIGKPNNPAHALVKYPDDEEIRMALSDYARDKDAYCPFMVNSLNDEIEDLRSRLPDIPYNRGW